MSNVTGAKSKGCTGTTPSQTHTHIRVHAFHQMLTPPQQQRSCLHVYEIARIGIAFFFFFLSPSLPEMRSHISRHTHTHTVARYVRRRTRSVRVPWALQTSRQVDGMTRTWLCRSRSLPQTDRPLSRLCASSFICTDLCRCLLSMYVCVSLFFSARGGRQSHPP